MYYILHGNGNYKYVFILIDIPIYEQVIYNIFYPRSNLFGNFSPSGAIISPTHFDIHIYYNDYIGSVSNHSKSFFIVTNSAYCEFIRIITTDYFIL